MKYLQIITFEKLKTRGFSVRVKNPRVGAIRWLSSAEFGRGMTGPAGSRIGPTTHRASNCASTIGPA